MTVQSQVDNVTYSGNGITTIFNYPFRITTSNSLKVLLINISTGDYTEQILNTNYTITNIDNVNGGTIDFNTAPEFGVNIFIARLNQDYIQEMTFLPNSQFSLSSLEQVLDRFALQDEQLDLKCNTSLKLPPYEVSGLTLAPTSVRKNTVLGFDEAGNLVYETIPSGTPAGMFLQTGTGAVERTWQNKVRETFSVKDFGAIGDGITDDTLAFINATAALGTYGELFIPKGTYLFNNQFASAIVPTQGKISLFGKNNITFRGEAGTVLKITDWDVNTKGGISIIHLENCNNITIEEIRFELTGVIGLITPQPEPYYPIISAIFSSETNNILVDKCSFYSYNPHGADGSSPQPNFYYKQIPVYISGDTNSNTYKGFILKNCTLEDINTYKVFILGMGNILINQNKFLRICGFYPTIRNLLHHSTGHVITDNYFEGSNPANDNPTNNIVSTNLPSMLLAEQATNKGGGGINISGNVFALTGSGGIDIGDSTGINIDNNIFYDLVDMSTIFTVEDDTKSCIRIHDEGSTGTYPASNISITNNSTFGVLARKGLQVSHGYNGIVTANNFDGNSGYGIKCSRARNFNVSGNNISRIREFLGIQVGIFIAGTHLDAGEIIKCTDNNIHNFGGDTGTGLIAAGYTPDKMIIYGNHFNGLSTEKVGGAPDLFHIDNIKFSNDPLYANLDSSVIDYFENGTWTPTVTFTTPGDLSIVYSIRKGRYQRIKNAVKVSFYIYAPTFHFTTAAGELKIMGIPFPSFNEPNLFCLNGIGIYQALRTTEKLSIMVQPNTDYISFMKSDSMIAPNYVVSADCVSGAGLILSGEITYYV